MNVWMSDQSSQQLVYPFIDPFVSFDWHYFVWYVLASVINFNSCTHDSTCPFSPHLPILCPSLLFPTPFTSPFLLFFFLQYCITGAKGMWKESTSSQPPEASWREGKVWEMQDLILPTQVQAILSIWPEMLRCLIHGRLTSIVLIKAFWMYFIWLFLTWIKKTFNVRFFSTLVCQKLFWNTVASSVYS